MVKVNRSSDEKNKDRWADRIIEEFRRNRVPIHLFFKSVDDKNFVLGIIPKGQGKGKDE